MPRKKIVAAGKWCQLSNPKMGRRQGRSPSAIHNPALCFSGSECRLLSVLSTAPLGRGGFQQHWDVSGKKKTKGASYEDITINFKAQEGRTANDWSVGRWQYLLLSFFSRGQSLPFPFWLFDGTVLWPPPKRFQNPPSVFCSCTWQPTLPGYPSLIQIWMPWTVIWV